MLGNVGIFKLSSYYLDIIFIIYETIFNIGVNSLVSFFYLHVIFQVSVNYLHYKLSQLA